MSEKKGIKETLEALDAMGEASVTGKKVVKAVKEALKNGFGVEDIAIVSKLIDAMPDMDIIDAGIKDADQIKEEVKDLDQVEIVQIIGSVYSNAEKFNKA